MFDLVTKASHMKLDSRAGAPTRFASLSGVDVAQAQSASDTTSPMKTGQEKFTMTPRPNEPS
jgi:hypothetical protein